MCPSNWRFLRCSIAGQDPSTLITNLGADGCWFPCADPPTAGSLTKPRFAPLIALAREQWSVPAQAGSASFIRAHDNHSQVNGDDKKNIRRQARRNRRAMDDAEHAQASGRICQRISESRAFRNAQHIALYLPMDGEVDCLPLAARATARGKSVYLPRIPGSFPLAMDFVRLDSDTHLERGPHGVIQPPRSGGFRLAPRELDLIITPLVAFDENCHRIGMGGGYYDRAFEFLNNRKSWRKPRLLGLAFECQKANGIHPDPWDVALWAIVTESATYPGTKSI